MDVGKLVAYLGLNTREFDNSLNKTSGFMRSFITQLAGAVSVVAVISKITRFVSESAKIEGVYQGIYEGFKKLNDPTLLSTLQKSVDGVMNKMKIMQEVVKARNFQIPMEVLATGLKFAEMRAEQTGIAVEELADAVIMSLGRQSTRSLVRVGISVSDVREELGKTGDFTVAVTNIMNREITKTGDVIESSEHKAEKFRAALQDWKITIGKDVNPILDKLRDKLTEVFRFMSTTPAKALAIETLNDFKRLDLAGKSLEEQYKLTTQAQSDYNEMNQATIEDAIEKQGLGFPGKEIKGLNELAKVYLETSNAFSEYAAGIKSQIKDGPVIVGIIDNINSQIELLKDSLGGLTTKGEIKETTKAIYDYEQQLKDLSDITPEIAALTEVQSKSFEGVIEGTGKVSTALKENSKEWASYKYNVKDTLQSMQEFSQVIQSTVVDGIDEISQSIANLVTGTGSVKDFFKNLGLVVANFAIQVGKLITAIGFGMMLIPGMQAQGIRTMAGGAAIMTAGYIAKGLLEKTPGNSSTSTSPSGSSYNAGGYSIGTQNIKVQVTGELDGRKLAIASARGNKMLSDMS